MLCHPHYLRDLQFCVETKRSAWAYEAHQFLLRSERARSAIWAEGFDQTRRREVIAHYEEQFQVLIGRPIVGAVSQRIQKRMPEAPRENPVLHARSGHALPLGALYGE